MARQSLIWTALPNGYTADGRSLRLSVLVSPRLDPQGDPQRLDSFAEWLDWPQTLLKARFTVSCSGTTVTVAADGTGSANVRDDRLGVPDGATWRALFVPALFVRPYQFQDLSNNSVVSYDTDAIADLVQGLYAELAADAGDDLPTISSFGESRRWGVLAGAIRQLDAPPPPLEPHIASEPTTLAPTVPLHETLRQFTTFHTPLLAPVKRTETNGSAQATWTEYKRSPMPQAGDLAPQLDFHQIVSAMGSYPRLMRLLGLVVDLRLDPASFPPGSDIALSVTADFPAGVLGTPAAAPGSPVTRTHLSTSAFEAVSDPLAAFPLRNGLLALDPDRLAVMQADMEGAGLKLINFGRSLLRRATGQPPVDPVTRQEDQAGAPSLRTAGLMLVQRQRADWLRKRFQANRDGNDKLVQQMEGAGSGPELHAEDLLRGYRVDIWDSTTRRWASLCRRTARYELGDAPVVVEATPEEESTLRLAATTSPDPASNPNTVSLHEALLTWNGWSLAAPPPGRTILPDGSVDTSSDQSEAQVPPGLKFTSRFRAVAGSLPRLRYGRSYWLRARAVDLAGNSLDFRPTDFGAENAAARAVPFFRFEPIAAPVLALVSQAGALEPPGPGESIERLAIRSFNDTPEANAIPTAERARRAAVPPRVGAREAEQHGMLDRNGRVDANTFTMLAHERDRDGHDPLAVVREVRLPADVPATDQTAYAVHEIGRAMTYLPDPLATEAVVRILGLAGTDPDAGITIPLYPDGAWPEARPFLVEVFEDAGASPAFDLASRTLRVPLPKSGRVVLRMSMTLSEAALAVMGIFAWLDAPAQAAQRQRARDGRHWMLTPWRELEIVHAVQRPLLAPDIAAISIPARPVGETSARPVILAQCAIASTDRLDLYASSHEPTDDGAGPGDRQRDDSAFQVKVTDPGVYATVLDGKPGGGYPDHTIPSPDQVSINTPTATDLTAKAHEFHDTRYRRIVYWLVAISRFREFMPADVLTVPDPSGPVPTDANITVTGQPAVAWRRSSAPPPAPRVLYLLPTFAWRRDQDGSGNAVSERRGGLRVYLDRPWNVSGYGEMLGVVLPPADFASDPENNPPDDPLKNYVTQWGADPVWESDVMPGLAPTRADFPLARTAPDASGPWLPPGAPAAESDQPPGPFQVTGLTAPGRHPGGPALEVAPHDVAWSAERQLWYCDIALDPGAAYFPFIRLALARYQPASVDDAYLSNLVLADFIALTPARWLAIATTDDPRSRRVTVSGHGYRTSSGWREASGIAGAAQVAKNSVVEVWVEHLDARLGPDFGWLALASAEVTREPASAPTGDSDEVLWSGEVRVPESGDASGPCRIVVAEYEEYLADDATPYDGVPTAKARRLVFVEHRRLDL